MVCFESTYFIYIAISNNIVQNWERMLLNDVYNFKIGCHQMLTINSEATRRIFENRQMHFTI